MDAKEYKEYQKDVDDFFKKEGITNLSTVHDDETGESEEPFFSWYPCECCGSHLGGDRQHCDGYNPETKEVYIYTVCVDCVYYAEYGQLDDMTMLDIEKSRAMEVERTDLETPSDYPQDYNSAAQDLMDF